MKLKRLMALWLADSQVCLFELLLGMLYDGSVYEIYFSLFSDNDMTVGVMVFLRMLFVPIHSHVRRYELSSIDMFDVHCHSLQHTSRSYIVILFFLVIYFLTVDR